MVYGSATNPGLTVQQAYAIDTKVDDGLPQSGNVTAKYQNWTLYGVNFFEINNFGAYMAEGGGVVGPYPGTAANPGSATTCYDNSSTSNGTPGVSGAVQHYSIEMNNGTGNNCAVSFRFQ